MARTYKAQRIIRHGHTDPAGFAFYPRYYELVAEVIEDFFRDVLQRRFGEMHVKQRIGVPTVRIETDFHAPSYCDDILDFSLSVIKLGRASTSFEIVAACDGEKRLTTRHTIVHVMLDEMKAIPFPDDLRDGLIAYSTEGGAGA